MVKRSKSIERTIKEAEQYLSRFQNFIQKTQKQGKIKINQNHHNQLQQKQGSKSSQLNSKQEKKQEKSKIKNLSSTQKTLDQFFQKPNAQDDNIQTKELNNLVSPKVVQDQLKQQEQIDVCQILMGDYYRQRIDI